MQLLHKINLKIYEDKFSNFLEEIKKELLPGVLQNNVAKVELNYSYSARLHSS